jgi:uroporphyrin-III C-methyltransferase/precorrin-2 dehydrogenase/sirohydrochlorin ferrochelatase
MLTLGALRALGSADAVLFDALVSTEVLDFVPPRARRIPVGKRAGRASCRQEDIDALMVELARAGAHVVRLKAGDPSLFGRAGEEIAGLRAAGVPVRVVPGVTAACAMAAALGVSLTHRDHARAVHLVTGHGREGGVPEDVDWRGLADPRATTVLYMGGRTVGGVSARLLELGSAPETPAVICRSLGRETYRCWSGCIRDLAAGIAALGVEEPVLVGIGAVFSAALLGPVPVPGPAAPTPADARPVSDTPFRDPPHPIRELPDTRTGTG